MSPAATGLIVLAVIAASIAAGAALYYELRTVERPFHTLEVGVQGVVLNQEPLPPVVGVRVTPQAILFDHGAIQTRVALGTPLSDALRADLVQAVDACVRAQAQRRPAEVPRQLSTLIEGR